MKVEVFKTSDELGQAAAAVAADILRQTIAQKGKARLLLSTGASQFDTIKHLVTFDLAWDKVEMFHLDEYVNLPEQHPASFRKYLKERFVNIVKPKQAYFVNGEGDVTRNIAELTAALQSEPIDVALIGIGENAHIAFNDPPADFNTQVAYKVVDLDEKCKQQQVGEGWFATVADVPAQAITMSVHQIMQSKVILSCVPRDVKAMAIKQTLESDVTPLVPATILKTHANWTLFVDQDSAALADPAVLKSLQVE